ncbi:MAG: nitroreductase family protein [Aquificaceae bacterium]
MKSLIEERRSITFFDDSKSLDDETIRELLRLSATAPSGYNLQPWKVIVVKDLEVKKELMKICYMQEKVYKACINVIVLADTIGGIENAKAVFDSFVELGYFSNEQAQNIIKSIKNSWSDPKVAYKKALRDASLFAMNLMLSARALGLETHPMEGFDEKALRERFGIEERFVPVMIVAVGYKDPSKELLPRAMRFKPEEFATFI